MPPQIGPTALRLGIFQTALLGRLRSALTQACFRPVTRDGLPLIGPISDVKGAYVATGHSVWGILNAPATGEAMAELILDGTASTLDLAAFAPGRLQPEPWSRLPRASGSQ